MSVQVSFYTESRVSSQVRTAEFVSASADHLVHMVKRSMRGTEKFACFPSPDGQVVALNHTGEYITL